MHKYNLRGDCCNNRSRARRKKQKCIHQFCIFIWDFTPCIFKIFSSTQYSKASELLKHRFVSNLIIVTGTDLAVDGGYGAMGPEGIGESSKFAGTDYQVENDQKSLIWTFNSNFSNFLKIYLNDVLAVKLKNVMRLFKGISNYCVYLSRDD